MSIKPFTAHESQSMTIEQMTMYIDFMNEAETRALTAQILYLHKQEWSQEWQKRYSA